MNYSNYSIRKAESVLGEALSSPGILQTLINRILHWQDSHGFLNLRLRKKIDRTALHLFLSTVVYQTYFKNQELDLLSEFDYFAGLFMLRC